MKRIRRSWRILAIMAAVLMSLCSIPVLAESNDNSLSSLGIITEGAAVSPEFYYSTIEYQVTVPAGTQKLELEPVTSNENAWIVDIVGTELTDGKTTVQIIVSAENGSQYSYYLYVTEDESTGTAETQESETAAAAEPVTEAETEPETEDPRYVKVERNSLQEAENTIAALKEEVHDYKDRLNMMTYIVYGLIGLGVVLLFATVNLILKKKDLKAELKSYMEMGILPEEENTADETRREEISYQPEGFTEIRQEEWAPYEEQVNEPMADDPRTVPKPGRTEKKQPEYQEAPKPEKKSRLRQKKESKNVEVNMIDL